MDLKRFLKDAKVDSCIFSTSGNNINGNFYYFAGMSKMTQVTATAVINRKGLVILTNNLECDLFRRGEVVVIEKREDTERAMRKYNGKRVGVDFSSISAAGLLRFRKLLRGRKIIDISKKISGLRSIKSNVEIKKIKEACRIAEEVLGGMEKLVKKCRTESDLALELEYTARRNGAEGISFPPVVAFGKNSAVAHHVPGKTELGKGLLLIDFGVIFDGYCSDITRMFYLGRADEKTKQMYDSVYSAKQAAIKQIKNDVRMKDVHNAADSVLKEKLNQKLIHSIGHGLGIEVHDYPEGINGKSNGTLKNNMVITIEPGYYRKGWGGIRIEDDVLVRNKAIFMTKSPPHITEI